MKKSLVDCPLQGRIQHFFRRGCTRLLLNTYKPHSFFLQNTSCIRKPQVISGGGGVAHPLRPPPRSAPALLTGQEGQLIDQHKTVRILPDAF